MKLKEFEEFRVNPTVQTAINLGKAITLMNISIEEKREIFSQAFQISNFQEPIESILSMWATVSMLEDVIPPSEKILAVREFLHNPNLAPIWIEEWARVVYGLCRASKDILDFIAIDIRNHKGISTELRKMLGHPNPDYPFKKRE
ncbi:MAG: hypothetical protein ACTSYC_11360 [Promethearchaeota archaeon]